MASWNTTCDIYRSGNGPPAAPDVAGVRLYLKSAFVAGQEQAEGTSSISFTHIAIVPLDTDVRDAPGADSIYVPDQNGTGFTVQWVERHRTGAVSSDYKRVYLNRNVPNYPTNEL